MNQLWKIFVRIKIKLSITTSGTLFHITWCIEEYYLNSKMHILKFSIDLLSKSLKSKVKCVPLQIYTNPADIWTRKAQSSLGPVVQAGVNLGRPLPANSGDTWRHGSNFRPQNTSQ